MQVEINKSFRNSLYYLVFGLRNHQEKLRSWMIFHVSYILCMIRNNVFQNFGISDDSIFINIRLKITHNPLHISSMFRNTA